MLNPVILSPILSIFQASSLASVGSIAVMAYFTNIAESKNIDEVKKDNELEILQHNSYKFLKFIRSKINPCKKCSKEFFNEFTQNIDKHEKELGFSLRGDAIQRLVSFNYIDANGIDLNLIKNNLLIDLLWSQKLNYFDFVISQIDFKSDPNLTLQTLQHRNYFGLNLLNHACRQRGIIGKYLDRIIDTYVDNLDSKQLSSQADKFIFTLPTEQFAKIANKIGFENVLKIYNEGISKSEIKEGISMHHSHNMIFIEGYCHDNSIIKYEDNLFNLKNLIISGVGVRMSLDQINELNKGGFDTDKYPNIYKNLYAAHGNTGIVFDKFTQKNFDKIIPKIKLDFNPKQHNSPTVFKNFLDNLQLNIKQMKEYQNDLLASKSCKNSKQTELKITKPSKSPMKIKIDKGLKRIKPTRL